MSRAPAKPQSRRQRGLVLLLPTIGTGLVRALQLLVLLVLSHADVIPAERSALVVGFGLIGAFAMMSDSGAGNFLLSTPLARITRSAYGRTLVTHAVFSGAGGIAALGFMIMAAAQSVPQPVLWTLLALAVTQSCDSVLRVARAPLMNARRDARFALADFVLFASKAPFLCWALLSASVSPLLLLPLPSIAIVTVTIYQVGKELSQTEPNQSRLIWHILEFGITGALSATYTQVPLLLSAVLFPLEQVASFTVVYRIIQALDILPSTFSYQLIPRTRERMSQIWHFWAAFASIGCAIAIGVILANPAISVLFKTNFAGTDLLIYSLIAVSFSPKSGNYALAAFLMGTGNVRTRLILTASGCTTSIILSLVFSSLWGIVGLAAVPLIVESLFALGGFLLTRTRPTVWKEADG